LNVLVLDDDQGRLDAFERYFQRGSDLYIARTADMAIWLLSSRHWDYVYLDHDLGLTPVPNPGDGMQVVDWIVQAAARGRFRRTRFVIHSLNDQEGPKMAERLAAAGLWVKYRPGVFERLR
jgi:hypothetical protein